MIDTHTVASENCVEMLVQMQLGLQFIKPTSLRPHFTDERGQCQKRLACCRFKEMDSGDTLTPTIYEPLR